MFRPSWKSLLIGAVLAATLAAGASQADAYWWGGWRTAYYAPCYTACYSPCYTVSYSPCYTVSCDPCGASGGWYVGWRPGPIRRLLLGPYRWYYAPYSLYCCYDVCWAGPCVTYTEAAPETGTPTPAEKQTPTPAKKPTAELPAPADATIPAPADGSDILRTLESPPSTMPRLDTEPGVTPGLDAEPPITPGLDTEPSTIPGFDTTPATTPEPPAVTPPIGTPPSTLPGSTAVPTRENSGLLVVWVPYDAKVTINGLLTRSKGSRRQYVSYGLNPGFSYNYLVRAEVVRDGRLVEDVRTVSLTAGDRKSVAFGFNPSVTGTLASKW